MIHVVLYEPEIPQNTGNILRSCVAFNVQLHVIHPLGFLLSKQAFQRAKMDYGDLKLIKQHDDWEAFTQSEKGRYVFVTRYGSQTPNQIDYNKLDEDVYLIFGNESKGMPLDILAHHLEVCVRIPTADVARSLNLANSVAIMIYEVMRQHDFQGLSKHEVQKGKDWLLKHRND